MTSNLLNAATSMDAVTLYVRDLDKMIAFYQDVIALDILAADAGVAHTADKRAGVVTLGRGKTPIIVLRHEPDLPSAQPGQAGLFHTAILFETQAALAAVLVRISQHAAALFTGSADHLVSEAFYLNDPEGNGIELYWDRPRENWAWDGGHVKMDTIYLDPNTFVSTHLTDSALDRPHLEAASVGHVHLQVGDTEAAAKFYTAALGFEATAQVPGALFVAAGGYHHHMAMNTWGTRGAGPRASSLGLGEVAILVPNEDEIAALSDRLKFHSITSQQTGAALEFEDPWKNKIAVSVTPTV